MPSPSTLAAIPRAVLVLSLFAVAPGAGAAAPVTYVALGDSTATGVGASGVGYPARIARRLEATGSPVKLVNLGAPGAGIAELKRDQLPRVLAAGAQLITIGIGVNDVLHERPLKDFARDLQIVADMVHKSKASVVICTLPDLTLAPALKDAPASLGQRVAQYNAAIETVAERHGFLVADVWTASRAAIRADGPGEYFADDGLHPSGAGYDRWADALWTPIERALGPRVQARHGAPAGGPGPR